MNHSVNKEIEFRHLGKTTFDKAWALQRRLHDEIIGIKVNNRKLPEEQQTPTPNYVIFCEHPHVYTLGKTGSEAHLLITEKALREKGAAFHRIDRGGDITYHGPGQLVCYPILDLENFFTDIHLYLRKLEEAVMLTLADFDIQSGRREGCTGVWLDPDKNNARKICAMGVRTSRWVTMHGLALNINTDLSYFNHIVPCGIVDKAVTSMASEKNSVQDVKEVEEKLLNYFTQLFEGKILHTEPKESLN